MTIAQCNRKCNMSAAFEIIIATLLQFCYCNVAAGCQRLGLAELSPVTALTRLTSLKLQHMHNLQAAHITVRPRQAGMHAPPMHKTI